MGSTSSGKFRDFPPSKGKGGGSGSGGGSGGSGKVHDDSDRCLQDVRADLEEVGRSEYFGAHDSLPAAGTRVELRRETIGPRLSVDTAEGQSLGFLPTEYNYLLVCMKKGFTYSGEVSTSSLSPFPSVRIVLRASRT